MTRRLCALWLGVLCTLPAWAQVYTGISASGAIVLSGDADETAHTLLIAAPPAPPPQRRKAPDGDEAVVSIPASYQAFVQEASEAYDLPTELIHALILVESHYNPRALSVAGAQGLMQLMPATARRFGVVNSWDPRQNILAGSRYLRWLLDYFGEDLELSLAAYNAGEGAVLQAGRKIPKIAETQKYVPRVLAIYNRARRDNA